MDDMSADLRKDYQKEEDSLNCLSKSLGLEQDSLVVKVPGSKQRSLVRGAKLGRKLILNFKQIKGCESWVQELFLKSSHGLRTSRIPKHLVSVDEKYLRFCLEAIHVSALKAAPCGVSVNLSPLHIGYLPGSCGSSEVLTSSLEVPKFVIGYPIASANGDMIQSPVEQCVLGSITEINSMMSILNSPLFERLGALSNEVSFISSKLDNKSFSHSNLTQTSGLSANPSQKLERDSFALSYDGYRPGTFQQSPVSITSGHSVFTDQFTSGSNCQGMLQCKWIGGLPHFEFSVVDQKELYVANAVKIESHNHKSLDYVYTFHMKYNILYDDFHGESDIVGKMRVSTSYSLCPNNSKVAETEFVLFGINEGQQGDTQTNSKNTKRSRKLSRVMEVFKTSQTFKSRSPSIFGGTSTIFENHLENSKEASRFMGPKNKIDLSHGGFLPNLELAAIVVKDHVQDNSHQQEEVGGWGLKFLRKAGSSHSLNLPCGSEPSSALCRKTCDDCSTSINIILPAGFHGRPMEGNGPSSILERWKSGGRCDCGGWDIGCPLTILKSTPRKQDSSPHSESQKDCKSFDIFMEASSKSTPVLKVTNVHEGLYFITFRPSLPILQCFSTAVAIVHSQSPVLRPKHVQV